MIFANSQQEIKTAELLAVALVDVTFNSEHFS